MTAEFTEPIRRLVTAGSENGVWKLSTKYPQTETWMIPADRLFNRLSSTHLNTISGIENPIKRAFYEMETIRGCWSVKELERQIASLYYERSGLSKNKEALLRFSPATSNLIATQRCYQHSCYFRVLRIE